MKFCGEPVATVTGKVAGSCGWCYHSNQPRRPSDAERENVEEDKKNSVFMLSMGTSEADEEDSKLAEAGVERGRATPAHPSPPPSIAW